MKTKGKNKNQPTLRAEPNSDPWYKMSLSLAVDTPLLNTALINTAPVDSTSVGSASIQMQVPHDVFSTQRIDEGTLLLLANLPASEPTRILDMGCGYGALGLPIAARYPHAQVEMVDRDLLAVRYSHENAHRNRLTNVSAYGSLGFRDLRSDGESFDWILCNVPARIGRPFIRQILLQGLIRLRDRGELRIVVIRDLGPIIESIAHEEKLVFVESARGPRHTVYAFSADQRSAAAHAFAQANPIGEEDLYLRDSVEFGEFKFDRPFDLGGDDPKRTALALPLLLDAFPKQAQPRAILNFRCGYGIISILAHKRWPDATVLATDRDLLATTFTRRNAKRLASFSKSGAESGTQVGAQSPRGIEKLRIVEGSNGLNSDSLTSASSRAEFDLILGELSPSAGEKVADAELTKIASILRPGGEALILALDKTYKDWVEPYQKRTSLPLYSVMSRAGFTVFRMTPR